jgi:uroporphyrinogen-III synthase
MSRRVLVTRPRPGAEATARRLEAMGLEPLVVPLSETVPLPPPEELPAVPDAVAVTSANALRHAPPQLLERLVTLPCFAVGEATAAAAREAGFADVATGSGDAAGLAVHAAAALKPGARLLHLCGRVRLSDFEALLAEAGIVVLPVETYDSRSVGDVSDELLRAAGGGAVDAVLLHSATAAAAMTDLLALPALRNLFESTRFYAMSNRIATTLGDAGGRQVSISEEPNESALLARLAGDCGNPP